MRDLFESSILAFIALLIGVVIGDHGGDQATLRDCAIRGEAKMFSGETITCAVKKEPAQNATARIEGVLVDKQEEE